MKKIILWALALMIGAIGFAQTYITDDPLEPNLSILLTKSNENSALEDKNTFITSNSNNNVIYIEQLGVNNSTNVSTKSKQSNLELIQRGNNNDIYIDVTAESIKERVFQNGANHSFVDFSNNVGSHNIELLQNGNNQNLIWYGGNTISENLKVTMQGQSQSIIIRNFE